MFSVGSLELLCEPEIDYIDVVLGSFCTANQEVIRLNISVNYALFVHLLDPQNLRSEKLLTIWIAICKTVLRSKLRLHDWKRSSSEGPS